MNHKKIVLMLFVFTLLLSKSVFGDEKIFELEIKNHLFYPSELIVPTGIKFKLRITNYDNTPEEFDSFDLNREKVIYPKQQAIIYIGPLKAGQYNFFGEYNPNTALGALIAVDQKDDSYAY